MAINIQIKTYIKQELEMQAAGISAGVGHLRRWSAPGTVAPGTGPVNTATQQTGMVGGSGWPMVRERKRAGLEVSWLEGWNYPTFLSYIQ
jgi:hypothetical protein